MPHPLPHLLGAKAMLQRMLEAGLRPSTRSCDVLIRAAEDAGLERIQPRLQAIRAEAQHHEASMGRRGYNRQM